MSYPVECACHFLGVGGIVFHDNQVLLVKLTYGPAKGRWVIPGGLVDQGETLQEAIQREINEETGIAVEPVGLIGIRSMVRKNDGLTDLYSLFRCKLISKPTPLVPQSEEVSEAQWIPLEDINTIEISAFSRKSIINTLNCKPMQADTELNQMAQRRKNIKKYEQFWTSE